MFFQIVKQLLEKIKPGIMRWEKVPDVVPIRTDDWPTLAARPANSALDCSRIARVWGIVQPDWRVELVPVIAELQGGPHEV